MNEANEPPRSLCAPRVERGPRDPTDDGVTQHEPLHLSFRNCCPICIAARGTDYPHRRRDEAEVTTGAAGRSVSHWE